MTTRSPGDGGSGPSPDLGTFLHQLSLSVKSTLAPRAQTPFLTERLYTLSSILKILGQVSRRLTDDVEDDVRDLRVALAAFGEAPDEPRTSVTAEEQRLRAKLAERARHDRLLTGAAADAVREYLARDLDRPHLALLVPPLGEAARPGPAPVIPDEQAVRARLTQLLATHERELRGADAAPTVSYDAETSAGYSAETVLGELRSRARTTRFAARIQWHHRPLSALVTPIARHAEVLRLLERHDFPVPGVLLASAEPAEAGASFLVSEFVHGVVPTPWTKEGARFVTRLREEGDQGRATVIDDLVALQGIDWRADGVGDTLLEDPAPRAHLERRLDFWVALCRESMVRPDPLVEEAMSYLTEELRVWGDLVLVHGDYRPGNIVYDPETLRRRAVIDWDGVHVGDHHEDIGQMLAWPYRDAAGLACGLFADQELLDGYQARSGRELTAGAVHYYIMLSTFRRYLGFCLLARSWLDHGGDLQMARAWLALGNDRKELGRLLGINPDSARS